MFHLRRSCDEAECPCSKRLSMRHKLGLIESCLLGIASGKARQSINQSTKLRRSCDGAETKIFEVDLDGMAQVLEIMQSAAHLNHERVK